MPDTAFNKKAWRNDDEPPFIELRHVTKKFGQIEAVSDVNLQIYEGELFCLLGGSGSGKTTILRMLAGFEQPSEGAIFIDGVDMANMPAYQRPTNMMFQSYALFPHMSVYNNIAYGLKRTNISKADIKLRVNAMLELVQLHNLEHRKPHQLSGGQRQRVALARALITQPKLLLLDEPLGALDKKLREETQFELVNLQEQLGITFMVVTHDQEEAMTLATRIGIMHEGRIIQTDEPLDIYEKPNNSYIASFIGSVNIMECVYKHSDKAMHMLNIPAWDIAIQHQDDGCLAPFDQWRHYGLRPEKIMLSRMHPTDTTNINVMEAVVDDIAYMGNMSLYHLALPNGHIIKAVTNNTTRHSNRISWDEKIFISWHHDAGIVLTD